MAATSLIHVSPVTRRHVIPPYPDLTNDVMLMSSIKKAPKIAFFPYFAQNHVFSHCFIGRAFYHLHAILRRFPPTSRIRTLSCCHCGFTTVSTPRPRNYQVFTISSAQPGFQSSTVKNSK